MPVNGRLLSPIRDIDRLKYHFCSLAKVLQLDRLELDFGNLFPRHVQLLQHLIGSDALDEVDEVPLRGAAAVDDGGV